MYCTPELVIEYSYIYIAIYDAFSVANFRFRGVLPPHFPVQGFIKDDNAAVLQLTSISNSWAARKQTLKPSKVQTNTTKNYNQFKTLQMLLYKPRNSVSMSLRQLKGRE